MLILRKEVIQPQVPLRLPCYDFTPVADLTVAGCLPQDKPEGRFARLILDGDIVPEEI